jgi:hypothetical protein
MAGSLRARALLTYYGQWPPSNIGQNTLFVAVHCPTDARRSAAFHDQSGLEAQNPSKTHDGAAISFLFDEKKRAAPEPSCLSP